MFSLLGYDLKYTIFLDLPDTLGVFASINIRSIEILYQIRKEICGMLFTFKQLWRGFFSLDWEIFFTC